MMRSVARGGTPAGRAQRIAVLLAGGLVILPSAYGAAPVVQQPRAYGHVLGDVLTQRIALEDGAGHTEIPVPPPVTRANAWFDRLPARIEKDREGHTWLRLDYQIVNAHRDLELANLPALTVEMKSGRSVSVPAWPVSIGPLAPDVLFNQGDLQSMQPDHPPALRDTTQVQRHLQVSAASLGLTLLAWFGWYLWRNARDASRLPFARAALLLRRRSRAGASEDNEDWVALHRAFNDVAGRAVQPASLRPLFERAPYLEPLRAEIEGFYAASSERFFARAPAAASIRLEEFSRRLRLAEKRGRSGRGT